MLAGNPVYSERKPRISEKVCLYMVKGDHVYPSRRPCICSKGCLFNTFYDIITCFGAFLGIYDCYFHFVPV